LDLPVELRNVLELDSALRRCFVVRTLLGFSLQDCAQLLRLEPEQVKTRTLAASEWLANRPQKQGAALGLQMAGAPSSPGESSVGSQL
jgi:DNA-directed RNA polymerase specialized sigma24 family protein